MAAEYSAAKSECDRTMSQDRAVSLRLPVLDGNLHHIRQNKHLEIAGANLATCVL